ncbi:MAG: hypothetical protein ACE5F5_12185 [Acidimicrobiia bacterium]
MRERTKKGTLILLGFAVGLLVTASVAIGGGRGSVPDCPHGALGFSAVGIGSYDMEPGELAAQIVADARSEDVRTGRATFNAKAADQALERVPFSAEEDVFVVKAHGQTAAVFYIEILESGNSDIGIEAFCMNEDGSLVDDTFYTRVHGDGSIEPGSVEGIVDDEGSTP